MLHRPPTSTESKSNRRLWLATVLVASLSLAATVVFGVNALARFRDPYGGEVFRPEVWRREDRPRMVRDLMRNHLVRGLTRGEVVRLIGEPTHKDLWDGPAAAPGKRVPCQMYDYELSPVRPLRLDPDHLLIFFDRAGKLDRVHLSPDPAW